MCLNPYSLEVCFLWNILSDESFVFSIARRIRMREVNGCVQLLCDAFVSSKFRFVICCYSPYRHPDPMSSLTTVCASGTGLLPRIKLFHEHKTTLPFSTKVTIAPFPFFPTMVSISRSLKVRPLVWAGLSSVFSIIVT